MASTLKDNIKGKAAAIGQGQPYALSLPELPDRAGALPEQLQIIARQYIGARRRSGEALLDAARWLHEARSLASHGDWKVFKAATNTSDDTAERLLNIHIQAMQNPQFADAIARNWLTQSAAALLARQSTPPALISEVLSASEPPTKAGIEARLRPPKHTQNPHSADFDDDIPRPHQRSIRPRPGQPTPHPSSTPARPDEHDPAHWFGPTRGRFVATTELAKWCGEQRERLSADERALLAEDAKQLVAALEALTRALT